MDTNNETAAKEPVEVSIVLPVFNEKENIPLLHEQLVRVMDGYGHPFEIVYVDDGSSDGTTNILADLAKKDPRVVFVQFRRNFGQTAALAAGFDKSRGAVVVTMDADLQNDPKDIPLLVERMRERDVDVVSGWRRDRKDPYWSRKFPSKIANGLISRITGVSLHDYGCTLKAYRREVVKNIDLYGDLHRFIPAVSSWMGVNVEEVVVRHHARQHGTSKYGISRTLTVILDLINVKFMLSYATRPIQIFGTIGLVALLLGFLTTAVVIGMKIATGFDITGNPLFLGAILFYLVGIQFLVLGLMAEIVIRTYHESQGKRTYAIKRTIAGGVASENP